MIAIGSCLVSPLLSHIVRKLPLVQHAPKYAPRLIGLVAFYWHLFLRGSLFSTPEIMRDCTRLLCFLPAKSSNMRLLLFATLLDMLPEIALPFIAYFKQASRAHARSSGVGSYLFARSYTRAYKGRKKYHY